MPVQFSIRTALLLIAMVSALAVAPVAPEAGNILYLAVAAISILLVRKVDLPTFHRPVVWMTLSGVILLAIAYGLGSGVEGAGLGLLIFSPLLAIGPLLALSRDHAWPDAPMISVFTLCGVAGAAVLALSDFAGGEVRAGQSVANPIHFADVALAAGFLTTLGSVYAKGRWRYVFLLGPLLACAAVLLSGTRGAVVALVLMTATAVLLIIVLRQARGRIIIYGAALGAIAIAIASIAGIEEISGIQRVMADIADVLRVGLPTDASTSLRLQMYEGAYKAFIASPWVGHGPMAYVETAASLATIRFEGAPHLHSDIADFAASGGVLGLVAYALFLLAPLVEALRAPPSATRAGLIIVTAALTVGYFVMGLTNAVFGVLTLTVYFSTIAVLVALFSDGLRSPAPGHR